MKILQLKVYFAQTALIYIMFIVIVSSDISAGPEESNTVEDKTYLPNDSSDTVKPPFASDSRNETHLIDIGKKQIRMIQAKIYSRQGLYSKSLNMYRSLLKDFPDDESIWLNYIDTLFNFSDYNLALIKTNNFLEKFPTNLEAKKMRARIYYEQGKYKWTYDIYENILKQNRRERGVWPDYAFAKLNAGDWTGALEYFSKILEHDSENKTALQNIYEIQKAHRPRLTVGYRSYTQQEDNIINTNYNIYTRHITNDTLFSVDYKHIIVDRPSDSRFGTNSLDLTIDDTMLLLRHHFNERCEGEIGAGYYFGLDSGFSFLTGLDYRVFKSGWLRVDYVNNRPWYDPLEAANLDGSFSKTNIYFDWSVSKLWGLFLGVEQLDYFTDGTRDYGRKKGFTGIITRRFETANNMPDLYLSYSFTRSIFDYEEDDFRQISMVKAEQLHTLSFNLEHWLSKCWAVTLAGNVSKDLDRNLNGWGYNPGTKIKIGKRFEFIFNYDFSSQSANVGGGETDTFNFLLKSIF